MKNPITMAIRRRPTVPLRLALPVLAAVVGAVVARPPEALADLPRETIADAARKVVKLYGAGGGRGREAYQSGILVSPDGRIVTVTSSALDGDDIDCVLDDGSRHRARLVAVDPRRELAVLAIEGRDLPAFDLEAGDDAGDTVPAGTRVIALSNLFGVAVGDERVSAQRGVVAAVVPLEARRGAAEAPFAGDVYVLDCTTNNPGSPGGAVVDSRGRLVGMLGRELRATASGIWLNYALPARELARGSREALDGTAAVPEPGQAVVDPRALGAILVPDLLDRTPPFVESVAAGSAAARAGLRPDDLLIAVGGRSVASRAAVARELGRLAPGDAVRLAVIRGGAILDFDLGPRPGEPAR
jgi:serine protease Do